MLRSIKYRWHQFQAWRLNNQASELSQQMRHAHTQSERSEASKELLRIGSRSNHHERLRDKYKP
jgi:hypothetical protein